MENKYTDVSRYVHSIIFLKKRSLFKFYSIFICLRIKKKDPIILWSNIIGQGLLRGYSCLIICRCNLFSIQTQLCIYRLANWSDKWPLVIRYTTRAASPFLPVVWFYYTCLYYSVFLRCTTTTYTTSITSFKDWDTKYTMQWIDMHHVYLDDVYQKRIWNWRAQ